MPVFDPEIVHVCSMKCLGLPKPDMFDVFAQSLAEHYPDVLDFGQPWIYSIAGGAMIQMKLYYAEGEVEKSLYRPGDRVCVGPGQARAMDFTNGVWAVAPMRGRPERAHESAEAAPRGHRDPRSDGAQPVPPGGPLDRRQPGPMPGLAACCAW